MDRSEVRVIVERELEPLMRRLGLVHWEIRCSYIPSATDDDGHLLRGECTRLVDYHSAHISFNPEAFVDEDAVLLTLRHELFHVVLAPFDLYTSAVERTEMPSPAGEVLDRVREHSVEQAVIALERMFSCLSARD